MKAGDNMEDNIHISFIGRNDGLAIGMRNHINLFIVFIFSFMIWIVPGVIFLILEKYEVLLFLIFPLFFLILSYVIFLFVNTDDKIFLQGQKKSHNFFIKDNIIYKDNKEIKLINSIKIYRYKHFLFMNTSHSMFIIKNGDYNVGDREKFIAWAKNNKIKCKKGF